MNVRYVFAVLAWEPNPAGGRAQGSDPVAPLPTPKADEVIGEVVP